MTWHYAWRDLRRHPSRTLLSLLGVAIATALLVDMVMLSGGIEHSFARLLAGRGFQLRVAPAGTLPFDTEATISGTDSILRTLRRDPDVDAAGAVLGLNIVARRVDSLHALVTYGVTPRAQGIYELVRGSNLREGDVGGVLLSAPAAKRLGAAIGDSIRLEGRPDARIAAAREVRIVLVRGIAHFIYDARDQASIAVDLGTAQALGGPDMSNRSSLLMVRLRAGVPVASVAARLRAELPAVSVNSIDDMMVQFRLRLSYFRQLSIILGSIALVVSVLLVGTLLTIGVNERIGDIAALRAIGISRRSIVGQVMASALILTAIGGTSGALLGLVTARWLDAILTSFPGLPAAISFFVATRAQGAVAAVTLLLTGVVAGVPPAWRAARAPIALTLRNEAA